MMILDFLYLVYLEMRARLALVLLGAIIAFAGLISPAAALNSLSRLKIIKKNVKTD